MKKIVISSAACAVLGLGVVAMEARAEPLQCRLPATGTALPLSAIVGRLEAQGYRDIRKLEQKDGCYKASIHTDAGKLALYVKRSDGELVRREEED